jgi:hypothetical protein
MHTTYVRIRARVQKGATSSEQQVTRMCVIECKLYPAVGYKNNKIQF